jgi:hypothetical protein
MRLSTPNSATASLLLLGSGHVHSTGGLYSGQVQACQGSHPTNASTFNASFTPSNATFSFEAKNLTTISGNVTLGVALLADGDELYQTIIDPCLSVSMPDLCPASGFPANISHISLGIPGDDTKAMDLGSAASVTARLSLNIFGVDSQQHTICMETVLRSNASGEDGESASSDGVSANNGTVGDDGSSDSSNSTSNEDGTSSAQDSGAGTLQAASYFIL